MITKVVIPVAGFGTRMQPISFLISKELLPIVTTPAINFVVEEFVELDIQEFIFVVNPNKKKLNDYLRQFFAEKYPTRSITFVEQNRPLGVGHAVLMASQHIRNTESFFIALPDNLIFPVKNSLSFIMANLFYKERANIIGACKIGEGEISKRAILVFQEGNDSDVRLITKIIDKPRYNELKLREYIAVSGRYIVDSQIFEHLKVMNLSVTNREIELTEALNSLCETSKIFGVIHSFNKYDIGSKEGYFQAFKEIGQNMLSKD